MFPIVKTRVKPVKGSAAFWYNLNPDNGEGNPTTLHASCPILSGSKWGNFVYYFRNKIYSSKY